MRPSRLLALGPLLVPFNFYLGRFDLLPNPLSWLGPAIALLIFAVGGLAVHVWFLILLMTHGQTLDTEPARSDSVD